MKRYIFDVKYFDSAAMTSAGRKVALTGYSYSQAWLGCLYYMSGFLNGDLSNLSNIELVTIEEL